MDEPKTKPPAVQPAPVLKLRAIPLTDPKKERRERLRAETLMRRAINDLADLIEGGHDMEVSELLEEAARHVRRLRQLEHQCNPMNKGPTP